LQRLQRGVGSEPSTLQVDLICNLESSRRFLLGFFFFCFLRLLWEPRQGYLVMAPRLSR
jgi:hypothetical protein